MLAQKIKSEFGILITAWMYFLRVPVPRHIAGTVTFSQQSLEKSAKYLPVIGMAVGLIAGMSFHAAEYLFGSKALAVLLSMATSMLMTGLFHEDGLADFFDAFGGGWWSKERILEIMKDSRIGTFGSVALLMALFIKFQSLLLIDSRQMLAVLMGAHSLSRLADETFLFTSHYVRDNDKSYFKPMLKSRVSKRDFLLSCVLGVVPLLFLGSLRFLLIVPILAAVTFLFGRYFTRKIGGYTGDCLGATQQITEICFYLSVIGIANRF